MGDLPLPVLSATRFPWDEKADSESAISASSAGSSSLSDLLLVLRQAIAGRTHSTDSILAAIADSARVTSGADGVAIASRLNGAIVCRARSGEIAPAIGAPLNSEEGISGACLRSGKILICKDALTDGRVDAEVCRNLGIQSIAVLPLRDRTGVLGILEAFATQPSAFGEEQVRSLQALREIAEIAYGLEVQDGPPGPKTTPGHSELGELTGISPIVDNHQDQTSESVSKKLLQRYWMVGAAALALLLIFFVIRLSWRQTGAEIASRETSPTVPATSHSSTAAVLGQTISPKPEAAVRAPQSQTTEHKNPLKNAADIQRTNDSSERRSTAPAGASDADDPSEAEAPSIVELAKGNEPEPPVHFPAASQPMPEFGPPVSQGAVAPVLIQKVSPIYPAQARLQGLTGSVVLDATISAKGSVRKVQVVSGPATLAAAAAAAVQEWRYTPGILDGKPVETQLRVTVVFKLP